MTFTCPICVKPFWLSPSRHPQTYCSKKCQTVGRAALNALVCAQCKKGFTRQSDRGFKQKFCSHACWATSIVNSNRGLAPEPAPIVGARWVELTRGAFALVDEADFQDLSKHVWRLSSEGYAITKIDGRSHFMHNFLLGRSTHKRPIDHENRNPLDNRRQNLRFLTGPGNRVNSKINVNNTSKFRGVHHCGGGWVARIGYKLERKYLGFFSTPREAAEAYDRAARELFGDVAQLNFE